MEKRTLRPYVAFDLETTGVDTKRVHTLEIGAVYDDGVSAIEDLKTFNVLIKEELLYTEPYAMKLNAQILGEIATGESDLPILKPGEAMLEFQKFCESCKDDVIKWDNENVSSSWWKKLTRGLVKPNKITSSLSFAGKNASTFDFPILHVMLDRNLLKTEDEIGVDMAMAQRCKRAFTIGTGFLKRRFIDLGSMYYPEFGYMPSQDEIMAFHGWEKVNHRAKDDAMQVVRAIRAKMGGAA